MPYRHERGMRISAKEPQARGPRDSRVPWEGRDTSHPRLCRRASQDGQMKATLWFPLTPRGLGTPINQQKAAAKI